MDPAALGALPPEILSQLAGGGEGQGDGPTVTMTVEQLIQFTERIITAMKTSRKATDPMSASAGGGADPMAGGMGADPMAGGMGGGAPPVDPGMGGGAPPM
jgi:hypothetical protein